MATNYTRFKYAKFGGKSKFWIMIKQFFKYQIKWVQDNEDSSFFKTDFNSTFRLRMNDFPSEPMYTFIALGEDVDFDDLPNVWTIQYKSSKD